MHPDGYTHFYIDPIDMKTTYYKQERMPNLGIVAWMIWNSKSNDWDICGTSPDVNRLTARE